MHKENNPRLGMYVHTHWGYNRPYAARSWTTEDWKGYLAGVRALGFDTIMVWPLLDCMPPEPNASDQAFLSTLEQAIKFAHDKLGMKVVITVGANVIGNDNATAYSFKERPYFICEKKVNPKNPRELKAFFQARRNQLEPLHKADALAIIDSDPGGYIDSTNEEFVALLKGQAEAFRSLNPRAELIYWMWVGWEAYNKWWAETAKPAAERKPMEWGGYDETLTLIRDCVEEPWSLFVSVPKHFEATQSPDLTQKRTLNCYGLIEGEPTFPLTNFSPESIYNGLAAYLAAPKNFPGGVMANAQTHCLQLPHTYMFAHFARGGTPADMDLERFADDVLPGCGSLMTRSWGMIEERDPASQRAAAADLRKRAGEPHRAGRLSGLLFGDAKRFLTDLAMNLELRAALTEMNAAADGHEAPGASSLRGVLDCLIPYQQRLGFADAYYGPLETALNRPLKRINYGPLNAVLNDFQDWGNPAARNGIVPRLLAAMEDYCRKQGPDRA